MKVFGKVMITCCGIGLAEAKLIGYGDGSKSRVMVAIPTGRPWPEDVTFIQSRWINNDSELTRRSSRRERARARAASGTPRHWLPSRRELEAIGAAGVEIDHETGALQCPTCNTNVPFRTDKMAKLLRLADSKTPMTLAGLRYALSCL